MHIKAFEDNKTSKLLINLNKSQILYNIVRSNEVITFYVFIT